MLEDRNVHKKQYLTKNSNKNTKTRVKFDINKEHLKLRSHPRCVVGEGVKALNGMNALMLSVIYLLHIHGENSVCKKRLHQSGALLIYSNSRVYTKYMHA